MKASTSSKASFHRLAYNLLLLALITGILGSASVLYSPATAKREMAAPKAAEWGQALQHVFVEPYVNTWKKLDPTRFCSSILPKTPQLFASSRHLLHIPLAMSAIAIRFSAR